MPNNQKITYTLDIQAQINNALSELNKLDKVFDELNTESKIPVELTGNSKTLISDLKKLGESFKILSEEGVSSTKDMDKINAAFEKFEKLIRRLKSQESNLEKYNFSKLIPKDTIQQVNSLQKALAPLLKKQANFNQKSINNESLLSQRKVELADAQSSLKISQERREELEKEKEAIGNLIIERQRLNKTISEATTKEDKEKYRAELKEKVPLTIKELNAQKTTINGQIKEYDVAYKKIQNLEEEIRKLESNTIELNFSDAELATLDKVKKELKETFGVEVEGNVEDVSRAIDGLTDKLAQPYKSAVSNAATQTKGLEDAAEALNVKLRQSTDEVDDLANKASQLDEFKNRALNFFSIANGVTLFQRALRSAYKTVTDLDKVMTETAVVTDFTVGDMWEQLPEYTKRANELGVTTKSAYESATLYYQQGLNTNEVMQLTNATLKMARIASLDAAEATDRMTNALRGFNMELNETNANRVADVYSKLAAITASDVDEISTAMTKTASIASSAGMQFETTAAFLSQIIETTRESAETAGTALKTVIARFEELKKSPSEIGEVDGEIVDANKVEGALRSVGISLRNAEGQFRNLDEVFLELAKEWKNLDKNTQRYIATIAAGSRQQSRFIAMMQNYEHTVELVDAAYNAAGASQEQYEKTLESLESKLNKLYNAWNEFTMSLANSTVIKGAVDLLTGLLNTVNATTRVFGDLGGAVAKALIGISAFKVGRGLFKNQGSEMAESFVQGFSKVTSNKSLMNNMTGSLKSVITKTFNDPKIFDLSNIKDQLSSEQLQAQIKINDIDTESVEGLLETFSSATDEESAKFVQAQLKGVGIEVKSLDKQFKGLSNDYKAVSSAALGAGMAMLGFAQILRKTGVDERVVQSIESVGTALLGVAGALQLINSLSAMEGTAIGGFFAANSTMILGVVAAAAALFAIYKIADAWYEDSQEKLERLKQENENVTEAANKAKDAYDNLLSGNEKYTDLIDNFHNLTYGTTEWTSALLDANKQALELIENYEGLKYTIGEHGEIVIDNDSYEQAVKDAFERTQKFNGQILLSNQNLNNEQSNQKRDNILNEISEKLGYTVEEGKSIAQAIVNNNEIAKNYGVDSRSDILELINEYKTISNNSIKETETTLKNSLLSSVSDKTRNEESTSNLATILSESLAKNYNAEIDKETRVLKRTSNNKVKSQYKQLFKASDEEISELDIQTMITRIANQNYLDKYSSNLSKVIAELGSDNTELVRLINFIANGENGLTAEDLKLFENNDDLISKLQTLFDNNEINVDVSEAIDNIKIDDSFYKPYEETFLKGAERGQIEKFENQKVLINVRGGKEEEFQDYIQNLFESISPDNQNQFLKIFSAYDFSNYENIEAFVSQVKELGLAFNDGKTIRYYTDEINNLTNSLSSKNLASVQTTAKTLIELVNSLSGADLSRVFSEEEVQQITATQEFNEEDFQYTGTGFIYIGDSIEKLQEILLNAALSGLERSIESAESKIANGERVEELIENSKIGNPDLDWDTLIDKYSTGKLQDDQDNKKYYDALGVDTFVEFTNLLDNYLKLEENRADYNANIDKANQTRIINDNGNIIYTSEDVEAQKQALQAKIQVNKAEGIYAKVINKSQEGLKSYDNLLMNHSVNLKKVSDKYEILTKDITDNTDALETADTNDAKYWEALVKLGDDLNSIFETDFFNIDNIQDTIGKELPNILAGGDTQLEAIKRLGQEVGYAYIDGLREEFNTETDDINKDLIDQLETDIEATFTMEGTFDATDIVTKLMTLFNNDIPKVQAALDKLSAFGLKIDAQVEYQDVQYIGKNGKKQYKKRMTQEEYDQLGENVLKFGGITTKAAATQIDKGIANPTTPKGPGSGSQSEPEWKNPYDWLYNITEQINQNLSERERLEKRYNILVARNTAQIEDANTFYKEQLDSLYEEYELQKQIQKGRKNTAEHDLLALQEYGRTSGLEEYVKWDEEHLTVSIDWDKIEEVDRRNDEELGEKIEDLVSKYETVWKQIDEVEKELLNIEYSIHNLNQESVDKYIDFENRVIQAIENVRQQEIDNTSKLYDSINEANTTLTNAVQKNIDKIRQDRQNAETEEEINKKERRLAYLRQDTSTANQSEILKLEQELQDMKIGYEDTLVDQSLQDMQDQNEAAAEQREREIAIMTAQLEWDKEHGVLARQAYEMIIKAKQDNKGFLTKDSDLYKLIYDGEGWLSKSQASWFEELEKLMTQFAEASVAVDNNLIYDENKDWSKVIKSAYGKYESAETDKERLRALNELENAEIKRNTKIADTNSPYVQTHYADQLRNGQEIDLSLLDKTKQKAQIQEPVNTAFFPSANETIKSEDIKTVEKQTENQNQEAADIVGELAITEIPSGYDHWTDAQVKALQEALNTYYFNRIELDVDGIIGPKTKAAVTSLQRTIGTDPDGYFGPDTRSKWKDFILKNTKKYETGGLVDKTGLAWLDGTKANPEIVLNAQDSANLIQLRDMLRQNSMGNGKLGDNFFDININVDKLTSDYDVEQVARAVEQLIITDATYRNVNAVSTLRK